MGSALSFSGYGCPADAVSDSATGASANANAGAAVGTVSMGDAPAAAAPVALTLPAPLQQPMAYAGQLTLFGPPLQASERCWPPGVAPDDDAHSVIRFYTCEKFLPPRTLIYLGADDPRHREGVLAVVTKDASTPRDVHMRRLNEYKKHPRFGNAFMAGLGRADSPHVVPALHLFSSGSGSGEHGALGEVELYAGSLAPPGGPAVEPCLVCVELDACAAYVRTQHAARSRLVTWCAAIFGVETDVPRELRRYARVHVLPPCGPRITYERALVIPTPLPAELSYALRL